MNKKKIYFSLIACIMLITIGLSGCISPTELELPPTGPSRHPDDLVNVIDSNYNSHLIWNVHEDGNYVIKYTKLDSKGNKIFHKTIIKKVVHIPKLFLGPKEKTLYFFFENNYLQITTMGKLLDYNEISEISRYYDKSDTTKDIDVTMDNEGNFHLLWINENHTVSYIKLNDKCETICFDYLDKFIDNITFYNGGIMDFSFHIEIDSEGIIHTIWKTGYNSYNTINKKIYGINKKIFGEYLKIDSKNNLHIRVHKNYKKIASNGTILYSDLMKNVTPIQNLSIIDNNGSYIYLGDNGCIDKDNNIHVVSKKVETKVWESGRYYEEYDYYTIYYSKIDKNGTVLIDNMIIDTDGEPSWENGENSTIFLWMLLIAIPVIVITIIVLIILLKKYRPNRKRY